MADHDPSPREAVEDIRKALLNAEKEHPNSHALHRLHHELEKALNDHGYLLGFDPHEISLLAGGGTPKSGGGGG